MSGMQPWQASPPPWDRRSDGWQPQATPQAAMRAAHTDRDRTVDVLKAAYAEGRLSAEEYSERFDAAHRAQTYGQLSQLVADLPSGPIAVPFGLSAPAVPMTFLPPRPRSTNGLAIVSLTLGILTVPTAGLLAIPAVVTGHVAKNQIRQRDEDGDLMATIGLVIGWIATAGWLLLLLFGTVLAAAHG
ncbi:hypothetical protein P3T36_005928 [Kitasatospora sp. MAP12-15]|uniref:DUF1707 and DUF4190 domain-containing protein n=1 Tax=unclassified Kitasatospora TaxID=2633591 RepID=UPI0024754D57|nr:DUF1707 and DUF4190 domain-containing protein [Kitasatospora sp. MAP12-44]MDH6111024.1 hypothetical protein [Kitasatospora sp. MAP12-44]